MVTIISRLGRYALASGIVGLAAVGHLSAGFAQPQSVFANFDHYNSIYVGDCQAGQGGGCDGFPDFQAADLSADGGVVVGTDFSGTHSDLGGPHAAVWLPNFDDGNGPHQVIGLSVEESAFTGVFDAVPPLGDFTSFNAFASFAYDVDAAGKNIVGSAFVNFNNAASSASFKYNASIYEPMLWTGNAPSWVGTRLPVLSGSISEIYQGEARGINDGASAIVGWSGSVRDTLSSGVFTGIQPTELEAVRWTPAETGISAQPAWQIQQLNGDEEEHAVNGNWGPSSVANDVDDSGDVIVGWIGDEHSFVDYADRSGGFPFETPSQLFRAEPFVWSLHDNVGSFQILPLLADSDVGDARAVSKDGTTAVGWSGSSALLCKEVCPFKVHGSDVAADGGPSLAYQAVRWVTSDGWLPGPGSHANEPAQALGEVDLSAGVPGVIGPANPVGTIANAVDEHGNVIVGQVDFGDCGTVTTDCSSGVAFVDVAGSRAAIWEVSDGYKGHLIQTLLENKGVKLGGLILDRATGVRTVFDKDAPKDVLITGNGHTEAAADLSVAKGADTALVSNPAAWLVRLGAVTGITTPGDQAKSFATIASLLDQVNDDVGHPLFGLLDVAENHLCISNTAGNPWCFFSFGTATAYMDLTGSQFVGDAGLARYFNPDDSVAFSAGGSWLNVHLDDHSASYDGAGFHLGSYFAHMPDTGFQAIAAGVVSWSDVDITRQYHNGVGFTQSEGSTNAFGYGLSGWLGYAIPVNPSWTVTPFAALSYLHSHFDAWSETGGPFPAHFDATDGASTDARLGIEDKVKLSEMTTLFGAAAWVHRIDQDATGITGSVIPACPPGSPASGFCGVSVTGADRPADWFEGTIGSRFQLSPTSVAAVSVTLDAGADFTAVTGRLGWSKSF